MAVADKTGNLNVKKDKNSTEENNTNRKGNVILFPESNGGTMSLIYI